VTVPALANVAIATLQRLSVVCHSGDEGELCRHAAQYDPAELFVGLTSSYLATLDPALSTNSTSFGVNEVNLTAEYYLSVALSNGAAS
jgi:hypothetical protein